jgi:imidazoleglycerol phosphate dehydratase HisB
MTPTARTAEVTRNTAETRITVRVNLDGTGHARSCPPASAFSTTCSTRSPATD